LASRFIRIFRVLVVAGGLALCATAQQGSNYDPPPVYETPAPEPEPPPPPAPPEPPFWQRIDYSEPMNMLKIALFLGSIAVAIRCYRDLQE
jgi:hypothetical protein